MNDNILISILEILYFLTIKIWFIISLKCFLNNEWEFSKFIVCNIENVNIKLWESY